MAGVDVCVEGQEKARLKGWMGELRTVPGIVADVAELARAEAHDGTVLLVRVVGVRDVGADGAVPDPRQGGGAAEPGSRVGAQRVQVEVVETPARDPEALLVVLVS